MGTSGYSLNTFTTVEEGSRRLGDLRLSAILSLNLILQTTRFVFTPLQARCRERLVSVSINEKVENCLLLNSAALVGGVY